MLRRRETVEHKSEVTRREKIPSSNENCRSIGRWLNCRLFSLLLSFLFLSYPYFYVDQVHLKFSFFLIKFQSVSCMHDIIFFRFLAFYIDVVVVVVAVVVVVDVIVAYLYLTLLVVIRRIHS